MRYFKILSVLVLLSTLMLADTAKFGILQRATAQDELSFVIKPQFDYAGSFSSGLAKVKVDGQWGYIDLEGEFVIELQPFYVEIFTEGLAAVQVGGKWGYINPKGEFVIKPQFEVGNPFSEGLARVQMDGRWGYINPEGEFVIEPQFDSAGAFFGGLTVVQVNGQWGYIHHPELEFIIEPQFDSADLSYESFQDLNTATILDREGSVTDILGSSAGLVMHSRFGIPKVKVPSKRGSKSLCINPEAELAIEPQFDMPKSSFQEELQLVGDQYTQSVAHNRARNWFYFYAKVAHTENPRLVVRVKVYLPWNLPPVTRRIWSWCL